MLDQRLVVRQFGALRLDIGDPLFEDVRVFGHQRVVVLAGAEVAEAEHVGFDPADGFDVVETGLQVEVRGGRGLADPLDPGDPDPGGVGGEQGVARAVVEDHLVWRVARCVMHIERPVPEVDRVAASEALDPLLGDGFRLDIELPLFLDRGLGARDEGLGIDQVGNPDLVGHHRGVRARFGQKPRAASVIEVDVGREDVGEVLAGDPHLVERVEDVLVACADPGVDQRGSFGVEDVHRAVLLGVVHPGVDIVEIRTPFDREDVADGHADPM